MDVAVRSEKFVSLSLLFSHINFRAIFYRSRTSLLGSLSFDDAPVYDDAARND